MIARVLANAATVRRDLPFAQGLLCDVASWREPQLSKQRARGRGFVLNDPHHGCGGRTKTGDHENVTVARGGLGTRLLVDLENEIARCHGAGVRMIW